MGAGRSLIWHFTCPHTLADSNIRVSSSKAGSAACVAETRKLKKYETLADQYLMVPVAVESHGAWGPSATSLIQAVGRRICVTTGEQKALAYLYQSISIEIQRGNCKILNSSYAKGDSLDIDGFEEQEFAPN